VLTSARGRCALAVIVAAGLTCGFALPVSGADHPRWYKAHLTMGEESGGYRWFLDAKGPAHSGLETICASVSLIEPPREDLEVIEAEDATYCGPLAHGSDSVLSSVSSLTGEPGLTVVAGLYRPSIRKVTILLGSGKRSSHLPVIPDLPNRYARGIPVFRYFAAVLEGTPCIRRVLAFDGAGTVLSIQRRPCP
jgi:hypothetical protein